MKSGKKRLKRLLALLLCLGALSQHLCLAAENTAATEETGDAIAETETAPQVEFEGALEDDPGYEKWLEQQAQYPGAREILNRSTAANANPYTGLVHTHAAVHGGKELLYGIDVSHHQSSIDWTKVKKAGVEFVFIRCGYTGYGLESAFRMAKDSKFETFIEGAHDAGLRIGIYYFSQATSNSEAKQEAAKTLELLEPYKDWITLPVVCDYEPTSGNKYRIDKVSYANATKYIAKYCEAVEAAGYNAAYYSYREFLNALTLSSLSNYDCWVAQFKESTSYAHDYEFWQYSSTGTVSGVTGAVDCDFWYHDTTKDGAFSAYSRTAPGQVTEISETAATNTTVTLSWKAPGGASSYQVAYATTSGGSYKTFGTVTRNSCKVTGLKANTTYYFKITAASEGGNAQPSTVYKAATVPAAVTGLAKTTVGDTSVALSWKAVTGAASYQISYATASGGPYQVCATTSATSCTVKDLQPGTNYYFVAAAVSSTGTGANSTELAVTTTETVSTPEPEPTVPAVTKPAKVTGLAKASSTTTSIKLKWTKVSGATKYQVRMCAAKDGTFEKVKNVTGTSLTVTGLQANTSYYFKVRAYNEGGWGSYSTVLNAETAMGEQYLMYTNCNVNLRAGASASTTVLAVVPQYTVFNVLVKQADASGTIWYKASYTTGGKTYTGYLCGTYITTGPRGKSTKKLTIRKSTSNSSTAVTNLAASKKLTVLSSKKVSGTTWYRIAIKKSGKIVTGYVPSKYVKKY